METEPTQYRILARLMNGASIDVETYQAESIKEATERVIDLASVGFAFTDGDEVIYTPPHAVLQFRVTTKTAEDDAVALEALKEQMRSAETAAAIRAQLALQR